jgi:hypothetical protein
MGAPFSFPTWQDKHDANLIARKMNFLPAYAVAPARLRATDPGKYEPDRYIGANQRCILLAHFADKSNVLATYKLDHFGWQSPVNAYEALPIIWTNPGSSIDENVTTYAAVSVPAHSYSKALDLIIWPAVLCTSCRIYVDNLTPSDITKVKIQVHTEGTWHAIAEMNPIRNGWTVFYFPEITGIVDGFRLQFYNNGGSANPAHLCEFDYAWNI